MQREHKLVRLDGNGKVVPFLCERCGEQRIGVTLNIASRVLLPCICEKTNPPKDNAP